MYFYMLAYNGKVGLAHLLTYIYTSFQVSIPTNFPLQW